MSATNGRRRCPHATQAGRSTGFQSIVRLGDDVVAGVDVLADELWPAPSAVAEQIAHADAAAADLVLIGRTDAARRRADLAFAAARFGQHVELAVVPAG